jgi:hypothetical protein
LQPIPSRSSRPHPLPLLFWFIALITIYHVLYLIYLFSVYLTQKNLALMGWGCSSVVECLSSMHKAVDSILSTRIKSDIGLRV